jgi:hypothetical protein
LLGDCCKLRAASEEATAVVTFVQLETMLFDSFSCLEFYFAVNSMFMFIVSKQAPHWPQRGRSQIFGRENNLEFRIKILSEVVSKLLLWLLETLPAQSTL